MMDALKKGAEKAAEAYFEAVEVHKQLFNEFFLARGHEPYEPIVFNKLPTEADLAKIYEAKAKVAETLRKWEESLRRWPES